MFLSTLYTVKYPYIHEYLGPDFIIPSIYGYKRIGNRFRYNVENLPQNIRGFTDVFAVVVMMAIIVTALSRVIWESVASKRCRISQGEI